MNKTIKKIGHVLWAIFRPRNIALFIVISFFLYWIGMFLYIFGGVLFDMYIKKRPNFPEIKALRQEMRSAYPNISNVDIYYPSYGTNDIYIVVETKKDGITEEEVFHLACMVREAAITEEFQQNLFQQRGLKEENYHCAPAILLEIMRPKKRIGENPRAEYEFEFCYSNKIYNSSKRISEYSHEGYAFFHCAKSFAPYIKEYLAREARLEPE